MTWIQAIDQKVINNWIQRHDIPHLDRFPSSPDLNAIKNLSKTLKNTLSKDGKASSKLVLEEKIVKPGDIPRRTTETNKKHARCCRMVISSRGGPIKFLCTTITTPKALVIATKICKIFSLGFITHLVTQKVV